MAIGHIKESLIERIKRECQCSFDQDGFKTSTANCENGDLTYTTILEYSNEEGSETASIIAQRIASQVPFSMAVGGTQLTVTSACTDCEISTTKPAMSSSAGLFFGGFLTAVVIAIILVIIVYVYHHLANGRSTYYYSNSMQIYYLVYTIILQDSSSEKACQV